MMSRGCFDSPSPMPDSRSPTIVAQHDMLQHQEDARNWRERALAVLPTGASTGSKRAAALYGEGNSDAHFLSFLIGCSLSWPYRDGQLILGTWHGIYFVELDGPRSTRKVSVYVNE